MSIFSGKCKKIRIADNDDMTSADELGYMQKADLDWQAVTAELMPGDLQVGGDGTIDVELAETGDTISDILADYRGEDAYLELTDRSDNTYIVGPFLPIIGLKRTFNDPKQPHIITLKGKKHTTLPSEWYDGPTAPA